MKPNDMFKDKFNDKIITSLQNDSIKELVFLQDRSKRDKKGLFLIEGYREILRAKEANFPIDRLFYCPVLFLGINEKQLLQELRARDVKLIEVTKEVFAKISYRDRPDGLLAVGIQLHKTLNHLNLDQNPFYLIAEAIEKPGNLGTMLRSSDAAGVSGVVVCDRCTDIYNPNVVRSSVGTLFTQTIIESTSEEAIAFLKKNKIAILAATPHAKQCYTEVDLSGPLAIVVGTEQLGLSDTWMQAADLQVAIPMAGRADSLNVAAAATILLFEVVRQRRLQKKPSGNA